jgi:hypothetical protein
MRPLAMRCWEAEEMRPLAMRCWEAEEMRPLAMRCWEAEEMPIFDSILYRSIGKCMGCNESHYSVHIPSSPRYKAELHGILRFMAE